MGCCYCGEHAFFVSAESGVDPISEPRQIEPAADRPCSRLHRSRIFRSRDQRRRQRRQLLRGLPTGVFSHSPREEIGKTRPPFRLRRSRAMGRAARRVSWYACGGSAAELQFTVCPAAAVFDIRKLWSCLYRKPHSVEERANWGRGDSSVAGAFKHLASETLEKPTGLRHVEHCCAQSPRRRGADLLNPAGHSALAGSCW